MSAFGGVASHAAIKFLGDSGKHRCVGKSVGSATFGPGAKVPAAIKRFRQLERAAALIV